MDEYISFIKDYTLLIDSVAVIIYTIIVRRVTCFNLAVLGIVLMQPVSTLIRTYVKPLAYIPDYAVLAGYLWYLPFAAIDFLFVYLVFYFYKKKRLPFDRITLFITASVALLGLLQLARLIDRQLMINELSSFYKQSVIIINISISVMCMAMLLRLLLLVTLKPQINNKRV